MDSICFLQNRVNENLEGCGPSQPAVYEVLIVFGGGGGAGALVRLRVRTNSGVEVPVGQNTGCP